MSIEECEREYDIISEKVFGKKGFFINDENKAFLSGSYIYEGKPLEDATRDLVQRKLGDPNASLFESDDPACKV